MIFGKVLINKDNIQIESKLQIWSSKFNSEQIITIVYKRLNVLFFIYENGEEDWLPIGSYIIEKAIFIK